MKLWRSGGWPSRDAIEIDLLAQGWVTRCTSAAGHETLQLTEAGIRLLAQARQRNLRATSPHDLLAERVAAHLWAAGRIVWRELSLRAQLPPEEAPPGVSESRPPDLWAQEAPPAATLSTGPAAVPVTPAKGGWRMARPDVFSVRNTSVEAYLHPTVHEIKVSRADLLSDLRFNAKRACYQWLCSECSYVFPAGLAEPDEIPEPFGVWVLHGDIASGRLEVLRPARHQPCQLPFAVWLALAKATPVRPEQEPLQAHLGATGATGETGEPGRPEAAPAPPGDSAA
ncbi:MAG: hypothetical protein ABI574_05510 [Burkholderiales bacterium]